MNKPTDKWALVNDVLCASCFRVMLLLGPPGVGKSYAAQHVGVDGRDVFKMTMFPNQSGMELTGHYVNKGERGHVFHEGAMLRAFKQGARLILDDIGNGSEDVLALTYAAAESVGSAGIYIAGTGEYVKPEPRYQLVLTSNEQRQQILPAIRDRCQLIVELDDINPEALKKFPSEWHEAIRNTCLERSDERRLSLRAWEAFQQFKIPLGDRRAAEAVFGPQGDQLLEAIKVAETSDR